MSVINQMLRDLDRQAVRFDGPIRAVATSGRSPIGPRAVSAQATKNRHQWRPWLKAGLMSAALIGLSVAVWRQVGPADVSPPVALPIVLKQPLAVENPVSGAWLAAPAVLREQPQATPLALPTLEARPRRLPENSPALTGKPIFPNSVPHAGSVPPSETAPPEAPRVLVASSEQAVLAQAQAYWRSGAREAALELLGQAVARTEREQTELSPREKTERLTALVRELARMQLSQGQVSQAFDLMVRLEPDVSGSADIWAMRGNAAQRLGQHQSSVDAYLTALKIRPDEPRWMMGAAVSFASLGAIERATDMAHKARTGGLLSPEAFAYLKQLGVSLAAP